MVGVEEGCQQLRLGDVVVVAAADDVEPGDVLLQLAPPGASPGSVRGERGGEDHVPFGGDSAE